MRGKVVVLPDKRRIFGADTPEDGRRQRALREILSKIVVDFLASKEGSLTMLVAKEWE